MNDRSVRDSGLRRVSQVTKWIAAVGAALMVAFAIHAADANPGRKNPSSNADTSASIDQPGAPGSPTQAVPGGGSQGEPVPRHTRTGGS